MEEYIEEEIINKYEILAVPFERVTSQVKKNETCSYHLPAAL
jgi:hypothetical protein